ncbi:MAG: helix-turn-helix transcriptional regulator [Scytonema sp. PMC 1069.18]|nr:helix-turn-helix transcriptional regulator [Scytonema sp. PMC 1069.18]MEC4887498.1 helix-turn-helix transcriptional regulator [Scytonema sp. PMC 1070.18]
MEISRSFDETLKKYGITGAQLSKKTGVSAGHISQFRNGKGGNMAHATLENLLNAMEELAPGARRYFCQLLAGEGERFTQSRKIVDLIESADEEEMEAILVAISRKWKQELVRQRMIRKDEPLSKYTEEPIAM